MLRWLKTVVVSDEEKAQFMGGCPLIGQAVSGV
jgi:hypothetical protein